jgi:uncharacterized membrane protein
MSEEQRRLSAGPQGAAKVHQVEMVLSTLLRSGVVLSLTIIVLGTLLSFAHHPDYTSSTGELRRLTRPGAVFPIAISQVVSGLGRFEGRAVVVLGLLLLIATPVMRVAVSVLIFVHQRDWIFVVITSVVLVLLILSFFLGRVEG